MEFLPCAPAKILVPARLFGLASTHWFLIDMYLFICLAYIVVGHPSNFQIAVTPYLQPIPKDWDWVQHKREKRRPCHPTSTRFCI